MVRIYGFLCCMVLCLPASAEDAMRVARVINGKSLVTTAGDTVRLAAIEAPNIDEKADGVHGPRPGEPLGDEARAALAALVQDRSVTIRDGLPRDRHNRLLGQVYDDNGRWLQQEMLTRGFAMVYSFPDDSHDRIVQMLAAEKQARDANLGIWANPYFRIVAPEETAQFINRFKLVRGRLVSVNPYHGHIYLNFSERWKGQFAAFIPRKYAEKFSLPQLQAMIGKTIQIRGWIHYHNAPNIDLTHPEQIEVE